ncbi:NAD-dependent DNA ligase LigA [Pelagicoccus enzymogenes]|uniref:NAD-dependent DNA ligase LigA n=1 Tax=Pelagicoccus enzymogenes TaxID=2773457 RepID=UPI00280F820E|nr:NAD-dependent DNA ligase LigA [Pelagicoccus enzymogenes]MDQ8199993.1 NAD-dependent DNA ligase LigA [Pelagicoccus enzymogenes]
MAEAELRDRWMQLKAEIAYHDELYYQKAAPEISDAAYDALKQEFLRLDALFGAEEGHRRVGDDRGNGQGTAVHLSPMLSLDKAYSKSELERFHHQVATLAGREDISYSIEPKVDGMAVSVLFEDGKFVRAVTRGDGESGVIVSENVKRIDGFRTQLLGDSHPRRMELRGEVFVRFEDFVRINERRLARGEEAFAHPRSVAAGSVKLSDPAVFADRGLSIVFFAMGACEPNEDAPARQADFFEQARAWGLPALEERMEVRGKLELLQSAEAMQDERLNYAYPTDGTVVKVDSLALQSRLGKSRDAPHWALAYKSNGTQVESRLLSVTFQVGRSGALTPVAELEEVLISGSRVSRASLHSLPEIRRLDLRVGDSVFLKKAGEIIPQIVAVNYAKRNPSSLPIEAPLRCPSCATRLEYEEGQAKAFCRASACPERNKRRLEHYVSSAAMDFEGWGPVTISCLVDRGYVRDIADLYGVSRSMLGEFEHLGEESAAALIEAREASKRRELWRFVFGIGIPGIGEVRAQSLAARISEASDLLESDGIDWMPHERKALEAYFGESGRRRELEALVAVGACIRENVTGERGELPLVGKVFVFTGRLDSCTRAEATRLVESVGGRVRKSVTELSDYLVVGSSPGQKLQDAESRGVSILSEGEFLALVRP